MLKNENFPFAEVTEVYNCATAALCVPFAIRLFAVGCYREKHILPPVNNTFEDDNFCLPLYSLINLVWLEASSEQIPTRRGDDCSLTATGYISC